jgi:hypothetical protein
MMRIFFYIVEFRVEIGKARELETIVGSELRASAAAGAKICCMHAALRKGLAQCPYVTIF